MSLTLSDAQTRAIAAIRDWYLHRTHAQQVFRVFGYAGVGKTTITAMAIEALGLRPMTPGGLGGVIFAAFTGKAVHVMTQKGTPAQTIHGLIYRFSEATPDEIARVTEELAALERELSQLNEQFTVISRRQADAQMSQSLEQQRQLTRFEVLEPAIPPSYAISRSKRSIAMLGGIASGLFALGVAFVLEILNPPLRTSGQMERALGVRPVISVPMLGTGTQKSKPDKKKRSKFGLGVLVAMLVGLIALIAKPLAGLIGFNLNPRTAP